jgi:hypothetical protein
MVGQMTELERVRLIEEALAKAFASDGNFCVGADQGERLAYCTSWRWTLDHPDDDPLTISLTEIARDIDRCLTADGVLG